VCKDVLPEIRRTGSYRVPGETVVDQPVTYSLVEAAALLRQHYWVPVSSAVELGRQLRDAGIFKQAPEPKAKHAGLFWFTGSAWNVQAYALPEVAGRLTKTRRRISQQQEFHFNRPRPQVQLAGAGGKR
jgi:hypothetical protein